MSSKERITSSGTRRMAGVAGLAGVLLMFASTAVLAKNYGSWAVAVNAESITGTSSELNTAYLDGCPIQSPDGLSLYMASNRPGGEGGIDLWVSHRASRGEPYGAPVNLGPDINTAADDFCPTPIPGKGLFFVSTRVPGSCGGADIYYARQNPAHGWSTPANLGCAVNSAVGEAGPSLFEAADGTYLYFSSGPDIYSSRQQADGSFGPREAVTALNSASYADLRPNVRKDGLEIVFDSNRPGGVGMADLWIATRESTADAWSAPVNVGPNVNTVDNETRGSFSRDGSTLYFGRAPGPEGGSDIFVTTR
ncbi:MAG: Tol-Pal system beta propeller repeat protein TolB [Chloroflexi bacterium]|nr:Tol-Pal system beta propeller repeat protein TolB [Chloroflexota bacterium]